MVQSCIGQPWIPAGLAVALVARLSQSRPCVPGDAARAFFAGVVEGIAGSDTQECKPWNHLCWFSCAVSQIIGRSAIVSWEDGDPSFRRVPLGLIRRTPGMGEPCGEPMVDVRRPGEEFEFTLAFRRMGNAASHAKQVLTSDWYTSAYQSFRCNETHLVEAESQLLPPRVMPCLRLEVVAGQASMESLDDLSGLPSALSALGQLSNIDWNWPLPDPWEAIGLRLVGGNVAAATALHSFGKSIDTNQGIQGRLLPLAIVPFLARNISRSLHPALTDWHAANSSSTSQRCKDVVRDCRHLRLDHIQTLKAEGFDIPWDGADVPGFEGGSSSDGFDVLVAEACVVQPRMACQTGFNYGLSALAFLCGGAESVRSWDLGSHAYVSAAASLVAAVGEHHLILGDSSRTLPAETAEGQCGLVFVDGGHSQVQALT